MATGQLSNYFENKLLNHVLNLVSYTAPTTLYAALFLQNPGETGSLAGEATGYGTPQANQRPSITFGTPVNGSTSNGNTLSFWSVAQPTNPIGVITTIAVMDTQNIGSGNVLWYGPLSTPRNIDVGDQLTIAPGGLIISLD